MNGKHDERCWRGTKFSIWLFEFLAISPEHSGLEAIQRPQHLSPFMNFSFQPKSPYRSLGLLQEPAFPSAGD